MNLEKELKRLGIAAAMVLFPASFTFAVIWVYLKYIREPIVAIILMLIFSIFTVYLAISTTADYGKGRY